MDWCDSSLTDFEALSVNPIQFLNGDVAASSKYVDICASLYRLAKSHNKTSENDPLSQLLLDEFDDEQIWQQIDLYNNENVTTCSKGTAHCLVKMSDGTPENLDELDEEPGDDVESEEDKIMLSAADDEETDEHLSDVEEENEDEEKVEEATEVDDEFFSLRQMEKFLDKEEIEHPPAKDSDDEIDYFNDIPSSDDEQGFPDDESASEEDFHDGNFDEDTDKVSARQLKYEDFFLNKPTTKAKPKINDKADKIIDDTLSSNHAKQQVKISKKIKTLEEKALGEADWQMKGEVTSDKRPVNSLLEEVLTFNQSDRTAPDITDEHTFDMETMIRQRIKDKAYDDVVRKIKETKDPQEYKKKVVLDSEKSKMSLQEIYEKEYLTKMSNEKPEEKEDPERIELKTLMHELFKKLDALSNFHFRSAPPDPEIKVITNLPSLAMEEVQPVTHTNADRLAPEEIMEKKDLKSDLEKTSTDRKRERRKKAARQKARAKNREEKLLQLADTNEKLKTVQAIKQLEQAAKAPGSQTTIIKNAKSSSRLTSSKSFFGKLEEGKTKQSTKRKYR
ncbi:U3 small nucleolar ribonucleoprotein MPP10-like [Clavelina lepadiformis]|uniref:U3 small nucleolar ribonucleoprotein MPP10-like n=1 Tax=Clavelina lepadiformis TaxID=159417 RepID=UPI004040F9F6